MKEELGFKYTIVRSARRKSATISVSADNRVTIAVPAFVTDERVREIIEKRAGWILKKIRQNLEAGRRAGPKEFISGEEFRYLGAAYRLSVEEGRPGHVSLSEGCLRVCTPPGVSPSTRSRYVEAQLVGWYKRRALADLKERVGYFEARMDVRAARLRVKSLKSRWGSCSSGGNLSFNWQIILAPLEIVDYVVVHELCHLVHMNHSPTFWSLVESVLPDCRQRRQWLRKNGNLLW